VTRLGWGVLGAADIARKAVLPAIAASGNGSIVALASRDLDRARAMLGSYPGAEAHDSYQDVLDRPDVDAVYIPLPNSLHRPWTLRALEAGKHVLCEKPLALDAREAEEMAAAATGHDRKLMEAFMYRFHPDMRAFVKSVREPIRVQASFGFAIDDPSDIRLDAALGGGALLDVGCYAVSASRWILGEPADVFARARIDHGVDMSVSALLAYPGGQTAAVWVSFESPRVQELTVITRDGVQQRAQPFSSPRDPHDPYRLMVESFAESVMRDEPVAIPPEDSIANMRVLDRIRDAFRS
jgi:D-xylose 1-dehydrogenase (NADP+, D-xylono-1,5-lactone-forming)